MISRIRLMLILSSNSPVHSSLNSSISREGFFKILLYCSHDFRILLKELSVISLRATSEGVTVLDAKTTPILNFSLSKRLMKS